MKPPINLGELNLDTMNGWNQFRDAVYAWYRENRERIIANANDLNGIAEHALSVMLEETPIEDQLLISQYGYFKSLIKSLEGAEREKK